MSKNETLGRFIDAQNNLVIQHSDFSLRALHDMAIDGSIDLRPHYQRRDRWRVDKQSGLIESFLLNVPVPPVYLSEDDFGKYSVIDGKQRITAIRDFLAGDLRLSKLARFPELEGCTFFDLPPEIRSALSIRPYIRVITLLKQTDPYLKYEVFIRLNTGGEKLLPQEIRNVAFSGPLNDLLFELSDNEFLKQQMKISSEDSASYRKMEDVEHVLRFLTMNERWETIGQVLNVELDRYMLENRYPSSARVRVFKSSFERSIRWCERIWEGRAFQKPLQDGWRGQFISPLFDAEMVAISALSDDELEEVASRREDVARGFTRLVDEDTSFLKAISQATNNPSNVRNRIQTTIAFLKQFAMDHE